MNHMKKTSYILILTLLLFTNFSCMSWDKIPDNWQPIESNGTTDCGNISGSYLNRGEGTENTRFCPSFFNIFYVPLKEVHYEPLKYFEGWAEIDHIVIEQKGQDSIKVIGLAGDKIIKEITLKESSGDFSCNNGVIKITNSKLVGEGPFLGIHHDAFHLTKPNNNNYILVKYVHTGFAPILIPIYYSNTGWKRYLEYTPTTSINK